MLFRLSLILDEKSKSHEWLQDELGVDDDTLIHYLNPSPDYLNVALLYRIAEVLNCRVGELFEQQTQQPGQQEIPDLKGSDVFVTRKR